MTAKCRLFLVCLLLLPSAVFPQQVSGTASRTQALVKQLSSPDAAVRTAAESELAKSPKPEALPILLDAAASSSGDLRAVFVRILAVYKDHRKIPVLINIRKTFLSDDLGMEDQLRELGDPAAKALMDSLPDPCDDSSVALGTYVSWVGHAIGDVNPVALSTLIAGLRSGNACKQRAAEEGMQYCCAEQGTGLGDPQIILFTKAILCEDDRIHSAASQWVDSFKGDYANFRFGGIVEVLIAAYQANVPPPTMIEIARLMAEDPCPRVTRFMRAAMQAPNPSIQHIAQEYLSKNRSSHPR
jgi:hypothetical protein